MSWIGQFVQWLFYSLLLLVSFRGVLYDPNELGRAASMILFLLASLIIAVALNPPEKS